MLQKNSRFEETCRLLSIACLLLLLAAAGPSYAQVLPGTGTIGKGKTGSTGDSDAYLRHVLNRVTYGPNEASWQEIREMGADAFIERQLHPETIDDSAFEQKLAAEVPPRTDLSYDWAPFYYQHIVRAVQSERQLQEVMTQFWENHFDTVVNRGNNDIERHEWTELEDWENRLFRANAFGKFRDLLEISAKSQAMSYFLDNYRNNIVNPNENYAREIMELHSLGVDCGYDQHDVEQVTRIFTGWTGCFLLNARDCDTDPDLWKEDVDGDGVDDFAFNDAAHDFFPKETLGTVFETQFGETGWEEGERVLDLLAAHPCTARFISRKLVEVFVTDEPTDAYVDRIALVFRNTDGDIRRVLRAIFRSPEFRDPAHFESKVKTPYEFTVSAVRALEATVQVDVNADERTRDSHYLELWYQIRAQGMALFDQSIPTGYDETAPAWVNANGFLNRWQYSERVAYLLRDPTARTYADPMATVSRLGLETAEGILDHFGRILLGRELEGERRARLRATLVADNPSGDFDPTDGSQENQLREMLAQMLGSPEFQKQ